MVKYEIKNVVDFYYFVDQAQTVSFLTELDQIL